MLSEWEEKAKVFQLGRDFVLAIGPGIWGGQNEGSKALPSSTDLVLCPALLVLSGLCPVMTIFLKYECLYSSLALKKTCSPHMGAPFPNLTSSHKRFPLTRPHKGSFLSPLRSHISSLRREMRHPNSCGTLRRLRFRCVRMQESGNSQMALSKSLDCCFYFCFLRQGLMYLRLASNSLCSWGLPYTSNLPASTFSVLRL